MRVMVVDPGFDYSTLAVAQGYYNAFVRAGYETIEYDTLRYLEVAKRGYIGKNMMDITIHHLTEIATAPIVNQVINDRIDVVLMIHGYWMNPSVIISLRSLGVKTGLILTDDPMQVDAAKQWSVPYEYVFSNERNTVKEYKNGHYLPVAADQTLFYQREVDEIYKSDILLGGSLYRERIEFIESSMKLSHYLGCLNFKVVGSRKKEFKSSTLNRCLGANKISIEQMAQYVAGTNLVLDIPKDEYADCVFGNTNTRKIKATCLSPRIFESFLSRKFCWTNHDRKDIVDLFPNLNIPIYVNADNLYDQLNEVLDYNLDSLYDYTLKYHTYDNRVKELESIMDLSVSKKELVHETSVNNIVAKRWKDNWRENFSVAVTRNYYTPERSVANCRPSTNSQKHITGPQGLYGANIVSNGPSLENTMRNISGVFTSIYLNETVKIAEDCRLPKGFAAVIHPNKDVYERCFSKVKYPKDYWLLASTIADYRTIEKWINENGEVYFFNTGNESDIKKEVYEKTNYPILGSGFTVGYSAIAIALYFGYKKINIFGLDFCYLYNKEYAFRDLRYDRYDAKLFTMVENVKGNVTLTNHVMIKSRDACLKLIELSPDVEFFVYGEGLLFNRNLKNLHSCY